MSKCSESPQLHLKEKRRFNFADQDGSSGLNVTEFLAFTHPSEVDHMAVRLVFFFFHQQNSVAKWLISESNGYLLYSLAPSPLP